MPRTTITGLLLALLLPIAQGCSSVISSQVSGLTDGISTAIYNNDDVESVGTAIPTFLVLIDSMIETDPESGPLLKSGAQLNDAYAGVFVAEEQRRSRFSNKSLAYAQRAMCSQMADSCQWRDMPFEAFDQSVAELDEDELDYAYTLAVSWLNWIRVHSDDWNAVAELPRSERILQQVIALQEDYDDGMAHLYLGGIATLLPPALGGKPEQGRAHFERAIELSGGDNMMAKVVFAQQYARLVFDQELHHRLLTEVVEGNPNVPNYVLINTVAQREAAVLLADEADYF